jgi:hypothetical protein
MVIGFLAGERTGIAPALLRAAALEFWVSMEGGGHAFYVYDTRKLGSLEETLNFKL